MTYELPYVDSVAQSPQLSAALLSETILPSFAQDYCVLADQNTVNEGTLPMEELSAVGLFDLSNKEVLYAKNIHTKLYPASLTKVMTAIVALKYGDLDRMISVKEPIVFKESAASAVGIKEGDQLTLGQALHMLLISSANDAAVVIAQEISGSVEEFCLLMNEEAVRLGATNTNFSNPHGLPDENNYTTAYDLYLIMQEAITYSTFNDIVSMSTYTTVGYNNNNEEKEFTSNTTNHFLSGDQVAPSGVVVAGGKTGTTDMSGHCLLLHVKDSSGNSYISVILKSPKRDFLYEKMIELLSEL